KRLLKLKADAIPTLCIMFDAPQVKTVHCVKRSLPLIDTSNMLESTCNDTRTREYRKHLIRDNANLLILFKQDGMNLKHVYNDYVNTDMTYDDFCALCRACWQRKYGFVIIDKNSPLENGRSKGI
ncbi:hypothetical protein X777_11282, partial [Ooceraea biroi]